VQILTFRYVLLYNEKPYILRDLENSFAKLNRCFIVIFHGLEIDLKDKFIPVVDQNFSFSFADPNLGFKSIFGMIYGLRTYFEFTSDQFDVYEVS
jgi:hypothetical protein